MGGRLTLEGVLAPVSVVDAQRVIAVHAEAGDDVCCNSIEYLFRWLEALPAVRMPGRGCSGLGPRSRRTLQRSWCGWPWLRSVGVELLHCLDQNGQAQGAATGQVGKLGSGAGGQCIRRRKLTCRAAASRIERATASCLSARQERAFPDIVSSHGRRPATPPGLIGRSLHPERVGLYAAVVPVRCGCGLVLRYQGLLVLGVFQVSSLSQASAATTMAAVPVCRVGLMTGAKCGEWLAGMSLETVPAASAFA